MSDTLIRILLIGDYPIFRTALRMVLETDQRIRVVAESSPLEITADVISEETSDLVVVDLPDFSGEDVLPFFQDAGIPVLVLVGKHDLGFYQRCLRFGIGGLILKEESTDTLFKAIEKIHDGEIWFDRTVMGETIRQLVVEKQIIHDHPKNHTSGSLTDRERQVVDLICKGMKNKELAERLFISETTVRHHLTSIFSKLEITSRLELVVYAFKNNLVKIPERNGSHSGNGHSAVTATSPVA